MDTAKTVRKYLGDLIAVHQHCTQALGEQIKTSYVRDDAGIEATIRRAHVTLRAQQEQLDARLKQLGGTASVKEVMTTVSGFLAGVYSTLRSATLSRTLRDDFCALHFVYVCQTMLLATTEACGDTTTADVVRTHQKEIPPLIMAIADCIPAAVVGELAEDEVPILNALAAQEAVQAAHDAWHTPRLASSAH